MMRKSKLINKVSICDIVFFITLLWSGGIWVLINPVVQSHLDLSLGLNWAWFGLMWPGIIAILIVYCRSGIEGVVSLFRPILIWACADKVYFVCLRWCVFLLLCSLLVNSDT